MDCIFTYLWPPICNHLYNFHLSIVSVSYHSISVFIAQLLVWCCFIVSYYCLFLVSFYDLIWFSFFVFLLFCHQVGSLSKQQRFLERQAIRRLLHHGRTFIQFIDLEAVQFHVSVRMARSFSLFTLLYPVLLLFLASQIFVVMVVSWVMLNCGTSMKSFWNCSVYSVKSGAHCSVIKLLLGLEIGCMFVTIVIYLTHPLLITTVIYY